MKFAQKLTISVTLLFVVFISLGGLLLVQSSFNSALDSAISQNTTQHLLEKYALETDLLSLASNENVLSREYLHHYSNGMAGYFTGAERLFALYMNGEEVFSNLPRDITNTQRNKALSLDPDTCILRKGGDTEYLLMASDVDNKLADLKLLSVFDVSNVFAERRSQLQYLWRLEIILVLFAIALTSILSFFLTRPIRELSKASNKIAGGAYSQRTGIQVKDEIGMLAQDFDKMAATIEEKINSLEQSVKNRDDFVSAFSHEIKTPMTALIGYASLLQSGENDAQTQRTAAGHIYREAKRLEVLSRKMLELMQVSSSAPVLGVVKFMDIYLEFIRSAEITHSTENIVLSGDTDAVLQADRTLAADLMRNLFLNALNASSQGSKIRIYIRKGKTKCSVIFSDCGQGIPASEIGKITQPFYMVDKSRARKQGNSGLGLALCEKIAVLHGDKLAFLSYPKRGTAVRFKLPLAGRVAAKTEEAADV